MTFTKRLVKVGSDKMLAALDIIGTFVFAMEGAATAIRGGLDLFGILVISFTKAFGGGIIRDLLIG